MRKRYSLTLDPKVMDGVEKRAEKEGLSKSRFIEAEILNALRRKEREELYKLAEEGYRFYAEESEQMAEEGMEEYARIVLADPYDGIEELLKDGEE